MTTTSEPTLGDRIQVHGPDGPEFVTVIRRPPNRRTPNTVLTCRRDNGRVLHPYVREVLL
jgi:hypothetical protein